MTQKALLQSAGDGTAIAAGYAGEVVRSQGSTSLSAATGTVNVTSVQISAGTWILSGWLQTTLSADTTTSLLISDTSGTSNVLTGITHGQDVAMCSQSATGKAGTTANILYVTSSNKTIFLNFYRLGSVTAQIFYHITATRIA
jgi:hypothetical protein